MKKQNYSHSAYMPENTTGLVDEFLENVEYARFLHYADILRHQMDALEAAGKLDATLEIRCLAALQDAQYSHIFIRVEFCRNHLEKMIDTLA